MNWPAIGAAVWLAFLVGLVSGIELERKDYHSIIFNACYDLEYIKYQGKTYVPVCVEVFKK